MIRRWQVVYRAAVFRAAVFRAAVAAAILAGDSPWLHADRITLRDGRELEGKFAQLSGVAVDPLGPAAGDSAAILVCDNDLTRTIVPKRLVRNIDSGGGPALEKISIPQRVAETGDRVASVGPSIEITQFDVFGRRRFTMQTSKGPVDIIQGITLITPLWTKVEALRGEKNLVWETRIATSSIPRETLSRIIARQIDQKDADQRLRVVRLYIQSERYQDAEAELKEVIAQFPQLRALQEQVAELRELGAKRLLDEVVLRTAAGQHRFAYAMLEQFPSDNVKGEVLQEVKRKLTEYTAQKEQGDEIIRRVKALADNVSDEVKEGTAAVRQEIETELFVGTLERMASFQRLFDDPNASPEQKLALAVSGWLAGADEATDNMRITLSLIDMRDQIRAYLQEPGKLKREEVFKELSSLEGATPKRVATLIARMKPPLDTPLQAKPGTFELSVPGVDGDPDVPYFVQLPPEYDPHRPYPTVLTLHSAGTTPQLQLDWWAGAENDKGNRLGQATRRGYIVVAPAWAKPHQARYEYSPREHAAVLGVLRDACRRFAIDTDRVFLSGHSMGGDAAWDIGLAHPDLWAGVIPIVAQADKYIGHYTPNAAGLPKYETRGLPMYFVSGELDGDKLTKNSDEWDRCLTVQSKDFDVTIVEYRGRGHENFSDEIQRLFDWIGRKQRNFLPKGFAIATMRPSDNFFWWLEAGRFPPKTLVEPASWPPPSGTRPMTIEAGRTATNGINIRSAAGRVTIWLPEGLLDFDRPIQIQVNGNRLKPSQPIKPSLNVLLEDVRTRGDRQHPFWAKVE